MANYLVKGSPKGKNEDQVSTHRLAMTGRLKEVTAAASAAWTPVKKGFSKMLIRDVMIFFDKSHPSNLF